MSGAATNEHPPDIQRVVDAAAERGVTVEVTRLPEGARTAEEAATAIGCDVSAICKSIVLMAEDEPVVVLASGANRVDERKVAAEVGSDEVRLATAEEAQTATGSPVGGTAPYGHPEEVRLLLDADLLAQEEVWAAAGLPDAVFPIAPDQLLETSGAEVADIARRA
jgi:prolyl-tRNA editing enzyme YbaK/EbsC (Cys-tRNA(Pro) deacylase)